MTERDDAEVRAFIERFAAVLADSGWQRMAARVFVALLVADSGRRTAAELSEILRASPAAVSGAVRYLAQLSLVGREREPGTRHDVYVVNNDVWHQAAVSRDRTMARFDVSLADGVKMLGPETPAGRRLAETRAFFAFIASEIEQIIDRWEARKQELRTEAEAEAARG